MSRCRHCRRRAIHAFTARRGLCLPCADAIDAERAAQHREAGPCPGCGVRVAHGRLCRLCASQGTPDAFPLPRDFDARMAQYDAEVDPQALAVRCWCGAKGYIESRYIPKLCESRCYEVCDRGHVTLMRRVGHHTYDQHERAVADRERQEEINALCARTKRRNGTENPRGR